MIDPRVASGLRDIPPSVMIPRERILASFRATFASFGFLPIETPHIERMEVLTGKEAGSDEVLRQIFDVTNKGGTPGELALRFDLTVPLARFVAKHVNELGTPFKRYAIGSVFRGERPAKGRFREFVQCDFDTIGTEIAVSDAEVVQVIFETLSAAGIPAFTVTLSNRKILDGLLDILGVSSRRNEVLRELDKLSKIGQESVKHELCKVLTSETSSLHSVSDSNPVDSEIVDARQTPERKASQILEFVKNGRGGIKVLESLGAELLNNESAARGIQNLQQIFRFLESANIPSDRIKIDLGLARGLDYYTGVVFETTVDGWEKFGSISSGGRYDNLASLFTDRRLPGVGASIGLDRLLALMEEAGWLKGTAVPAPVLVANFPGTDPAVPFRLASILRKEGVGAEVFPDALQIGKQMGYGSARGHKLAVIVGPDEVAKQVFNIRDLATRKEEKGLPWDALVDSVKSYLSVMEGESS